MPPSKINAGIPAELDRIILKALEKDRETRYQGAAELRADLKRLKRAADSGEATAAIAPATSWPADAARRSRQTSGRHRRGASRCSLARRCSPRWRLPACSSIDSMTTPALTQKDSVVLSSVVNRTGDTMFDDTLGEALALQLRQSPFLNVVPEQQVQATLRLMGREPMTPITAEVGREICQRAAAKALLGGTIAMLGSSYVLTLNAQDCVNGRVHCRGTGAGDAPRKPCCRRWAPPCRHFARSSASRSRRSSGTTRRSRKRRRRRWRR